MRPKTAKWLDAVKPLAVALVTAGILLCAFGIAAACEVCSCAETEERTFIDNIEVVNPCGLAILVLAIIGVVLTLALALRHRRRRDQ